MLNWWEVKRHSTFSLELTNEELVKGFSSVLAILQIGWESDKEDKFLIFIVSTYFFVHRVDDVNIEDAVVAQWWNG